MKQFLFEIGQIFILHLDQIALVVLSVFTYKLFEFIFRRLGSNKYISTNFKCENYVLDSSYYSEPMALNIEIINKTQWPRRIDLCTSHADSKITTSIEKAFSGEILKPAAPKVFLDYLDITDTVTTSTYNKFYQQISLMPGCTLTVTSIDKMKIHHFFNTSSN